MGKERARREVRGGSLVRDKKVKKKVNSRKWARREVQGEAWSASHDDPSAAFAIAHTRENCYSVIVSTIFAELSYRVFADNCLLRIGPLLRKHAHLVVS